MLTFLHTLFPRKPSIRYVLTALTGAVMVWTFEGNIVLHPQSARDLAARLEKAADLAEQSMQLSTQGNKS